MTTGVRSNTLANLSTKLYRPSVNNSVDRSTRLIYLPNQAYLRLLTLVGEPLGILENQTRSGDAFVMSAYPGMTRGFEEAIDYPAAKYADQNKRDYQN